MDLQYNLNAGMVISQHFSFCLFLFALDINSPWGFHFICRIIAFYFCEECWNILKYNVLRYV